MKNQLKYLLLILSFGLTLPLTSTLAEEEVYGWQLMTEQERLEYRTKMQNMTTAEERHRFQIEHHEMMEKRAKEQNKMLHDGPKNQNRMMDNRAPGGGMGSGGSGGR